MQEVDKIAEECDWVTHFTPEEIVGIICNLMENHLESLVDEQSLADLVDELIELQNKK